MSRAILAAVLATGCFSVPPYEPEVAVSYTEAGTGPGSIVAGPGFALRFANGDGVHFPDSLLIDNEEVLGKQESQICFLDSGVGFRLVPTKRISADSDLSLTNNTLTPTLLGPAVVQVKIEWGIQLGCDRARSPGGTSTYTVFPDGRIVRHDTFADSSPDTIFPMPCACKWIDPGPGQYQTFGIAAFWTLARARVDKIYLPEVGAQDPPPTDTEAPGDQTACAQSDALYQVAFAWRNPSRTYFRGAADLIAFGRDLVNPGDSMLTSFMEEDSSALFIEHKGCAAALLRAVQHAQPPLLMINGQPTMPSARDGIYGSDSSDGQPGFAVDGDRVELSGSGGGAFAVWLRFSHPVDALHAERKVVTGAWYVPQRVGDRSWILWFPAPLSGTETITIEAR